MPGEEDPNASSSDVRSQVALTGPAGQLAIEDQTNSSAQAATAAQPAPAKEDLGAKQLAAMAAVEKLSATKGQCDN